MPNVIQLNEHWHGMSWSVALHRAGGGNYQSLINAALREHTTRKKEPLEATLRRVLQKLLPDHLGRFPLTRPPGSTA